MNAEEYFKEWSGIKGDIPKSTIHFHQELLDFAEAYAEKYYQEKKREANQFHCEESVYSDKVCKEQCFYCKE